MGARAGGCAVLRKPGVWRWGWTIVTGVIRTFGTQKRAWAGVDSFLVMDGFVKMKLVAEAFMPRSKAKGGAKATWRRPFTGRTVATEPRFTRAEWKIKVLTNS